ncbi:hypothetical protein H257_00840 [Aphanomyces astaci]|uniref:Uncharacterized protein n=1 Tax=Aphanomyces astaci TaxID=112090 RepID=W4HDI5_APHAT|nr:hypothetical protein H257_00840 [Aphanomyces astaci]ETV89636.1 hypothetical protein H257_00840 [Aphanomyces astaci]|eukprot:XP_009822036.1 hypothetical protein H257_00840 [Aphanomyces astaci]
MFAPRNVMHAMICTTKQLPGCTPTLFSGLVWASQHENATKLNKAAPRDAALVKLTRHDLDGQHATRAMEPKNATVPKRTDNMDNANELFPTLPHDSTRNERKAAASTPVTDTKGVRSMSIGSDDDRNTSHTLRPATSSFWRRCGVFVVLSTIRPAE